MPKLKNNMVLIQLILWLSVMNLCVAVKLSGGYHTLATIVSWVFVGIMIEYYAELRAKKENYSSESQ